MSRPPMYQRATVTRVIKETADARTFVLTPRTDPSTTAGHKLHLPRRRRR